MYLLTVIKSIFRLLDSRAMKQYIGIQIFYFLSAIFQVLGIASIGPFIAIISNPEIIHTNSILSWTYERFGFERDITFIIAAALGSLVMILMSNAVAGLTMWFTYKFSVVLGGRLQRTLYRGFLLQDYLYHKTKNYNKLIAVVSQQVPRFVYMVFQPFLLLTSKLFIGMIVLMGLLLFNPLLAVIAGVLIGGAYLATYVFLRHNLFRHGEYVSYKNSRIQSILSESFVGIKDVKLGCMEQNYIDQFNEVNLRGLRSQAFIALSGEIPKFIIESVAFGAILLLAVVLLITQDDMRSIVPVLSIYALAGYKLLPTMQQIYKSISSLSGHGAVATSIGAALRDIEKNEAGPISAEKMSVHTVEFSGISFEYPESNEPAIKDISFALERGKIYSLAGHSGSGKSTLADVLLGLLYPSEGQIKVNGEPITDSLRLGFRNSLSYVAQNIFILEGSVIENVAFGEVERDIDMERVKRALSLANASDFVAQLPQGLETNLGQDGKLLSGGQRQRIGIARALYRQTDLLVLDEPTSALDIVSEVNLLKNLNKLKKDMIILIISHRPASIQMSDEIILMDKGSIVDRGGYESLIERIPSFKSMMTEEVHYDD
ncbi:ABC transporter ATP-binding protein [Marinimicrobium alkaliphilum]|uniref:ABC transporter ATP-binding protein n=1 Tax=Marinimicrobium alkaliphilum TaxID=2202654 RepID=UPI000DB91C90|nr:ABC transporter ATP-binding protein [Marinimicrobium alkaliphilum]